MPNSHHKNILFEEIQFVGRTLVYKILTIVVVLVVVISLTQLWIDRLEVGYLFWVSIFVLFICMLAIYQLRMVTTIDDNHLTMRLSPFKKRSWELEEMSTLKIIDTKFSSIWGFGKLSRFGRHYSLYGNRGIQFISAGQKIVIGTQKEQELRDSIAHLLK